MNFHLTYLKTITFSGVIAFIPVLFLSCQGYNLDGRIQAALQPGLSLNSSALAVVPLSNQGVSRKLSGYTSGGTPPYQYSMTITGTVQSYMIVNLTNDVFFVGRNTSVLMPSSLVSLPQMPNLEITVKDASGSTHSISGTLPIYLKRVYVTKDVIGFDSTLWNTGGTNDYSSCSSGDPVEKANCRCQVVAKAKNLPGSEKMRAWLSSTAIDVNCNLYGVSGKACSPPQYAGGPWYNTAGNLVAEDLGTGTARGLLATNNSTNQPLQAAIQFFEDATSAASITVWNGSDSTGIAIGASTCSNWTSGGGTIQYGRVDGVNSATSAPFWNGGSQTCSATPTMGFFCFQAD